MPRDTDRDRLLDQLLRQPITDPSASTGSCVDGEMLAAWTAGALRADAAAAVEQHVADCARCQTMLAAFARATPIAPAAEPWWQRWHVRWLVPLATAATVAAVWVAIPDQRRSREPVLLETVSDRKPSPELQSQEKEAAAAAPVRGEPSGSDAKAPAPVGQAKARTAAGSTVVEGRSASAQDRFAKEADRPVAQMAAPRTREEDKAEANAANASSPAPVRPADPMVGFETRSVARESPIMMEFASPSAASRWRVTGTTVQRSIDGGTRWEPATIAASDPPIAGHSPSASIAWLVGRRGAVYVTTDGSRFLRVPFVEAVDLASVVAIDDRQATVTAVDGRTFRTTNRGESWIRASPEV